MKGPLDFIQTRHEEMAASWPAPTRSSPARSACAWPRRGRAHPPLERALRREEGQPAGPGDRRPAGATALGADYQQEVDLISLFKDVAHPYVHMASHPAQARTLVDQGLRIAKAERTVTCIILPSDVQQAPAAAPAARARDVIAASAFGEPRVLPGDADLERAADALNGGGRVAMLVGAGASNATAEIVAVAERLRRPRQGAAGQGGAPRRPALRDRPRSGFWAPRPSYDLMMDCDTLLMVGSNFPYSEYLPPEGGARGPIDIDPAALAALPDGGPAGGRCRAHLARAIAAPEGARPRPLAREDRARRRRLVGGRGKAARLAAQPLNPELFFWELSDRLPANSLVAVDTGMSTTFFARAIRVRRRLQVAVSGTLATMGPAVSYAAAAKQAFPDQPAFAFVGDGAMQMLGLEQALIAVSKYWRRWADPRFVVAVLNNRDLDGRRGSCAGWAARPAAADPGRARFRLCRLRRDAGLHRPAPGPFRRCRGRPGCRAGGDAAGRHRPARRSQRLIALPPHATFEQATKFFAALAQSDPDRDAGAEAARATARVVRTMWRARPRRSTVCR